MDYYIKSTRQYTTKPNLTMHMIGIYVNDN